MTTGADDDLVMQEIEDSCYCDSYGTCFNCWEAKAAEHLRTCARDAGIRNACLILGLLGLYLHLAMALERVGCVPTCRCHREAGDSLCPMHSPEDY